MIDKKQMHKETKSMLKSFDASERLPCRGCTWQCSNYSKCNGKLWRMPVDLSTVDKGN